MPDLSILLSPAPYHILSYGTLLGASCYQSFVNGIVSYRALGRPSFSHLQEKLIPIYFAIETALPVAIALTYPKARTISGLAGGEGSNGLLGVLEARNRVGVLFPIAGMLLCHGANLVFLGPVTTNIMLKRRKQETKDGKRAYDKGPHSPEMERLNKGFGMWHGISALVNMIGIGFTVWYGFTLAERLQ